MAQTLGHLVFLRCDYRRMPLLMSVDRARFRGVARPGDALEVSAKIFHEGSGYVAGEAETRLAGRPIADATLRLRLIDSFPQVVEAMRRRSIRVGLGAAQGEPAP